MTCHQSGHIPPPAESRGGWPLSFNSIRHSPPAESLGKQVGRLTYIFLSSWGLEAYTTLRNGCRCHRHCDFWVCGLVPWHLWDPDQSTCVATIYDLNSGVFLSTLLHMPSPNRGVVWRSVQSVFTRLLPRLLLVFLFPRICASVCQPITEVWTVFPPRRDANRLRRRPESPFTCSYMGSSLDQYLSTDSSV